MMMRIHYAIFISLWLNCVFGAEGPKTSATSRPNIVIQQSRLLMVMNSAELADRQIEAKESERISFNHATATVVENGTDMTTILSFGNATESNVQINTFAITFKFKQDGGYWMLSDSTINLKGFEKSPKTEITFDNVVLISDIGLEAYDSWSFHCSKFGPLYPAKTPGNHTFHISLRDFQIHPFTSNMAKFGNNVYECVGFFSIGILMGLFVTLFLMAIIAWGLTMIMDVKTMDRFDDPKGKPISFGGTE